MFGRRSSKGTSVSQSGLSADDAETLVADKPEAAPVSSKKIDSTSSYSSSVASYSDTKPDAQLLAAKDTIYNLLIKRLDIAGSSRLPREALKQPIINMIEEIVTEQKLPVNQAEQQWLATQILDDMLGNGPLEPLLRDESVTDIMVNGPKQVFIERNGMIELTDIAFRDDAHVMAIASRIVTDAGRRVDESNPICDARLPDGSRVNVVAPPCSVHGTTISIRKFAKKKITLDSMIDSGSVSPSLCKLLKVCAAIRLNILVTGGTGSGKTTMLNALSRMIYPRERIITIEDTAELQLQQPHVVTMEARHANLEGQGEITIRDLVKNSLRMRPDRIIVGEVRGGEAFDLLQAMNTGHDGSMGTLHANTPREALTRLEHMIGMAGVPLSNHAMRGQIAHSIHLIVQVSRMRDGVRRVTQVSEIVGMEGEVIVMQDLFTFDYQGEGEDGKIIGEFRSTGIRPGFTRQASYFGLEKSLIEAMMGK